MLYVELANDQGEVIRRVVAEPRGWGFPYRQLHKQTPTSGWDLFLAESHNNFRNPFQQALEDLYRQRVRERKGGYGLILRDIVREGGRGVDSKSRLHLKYISHAGMKEEDEQDVFWPENGYWVPTSDGIFAYGTIAPFETVKDRSVAIRRLESNGIPGEFVSYSYRLDKYNGDWFVGRGFLPGVVGGGRFCVDADRLPSGSGGGWVASLPPYEETKALFRVQIRVQIPQKVKIK